MSTSENAGDRMLALLKEHEGKAYTITHLSKTLNVSKISTRKHAKKLSSDMNGDVEKETDEGCVRMAKGPGKVTGTGVLIWFGKGKYSGIEGQAE
jgi:hypothetical protein